MSKAIGIFDSGYGGLTVFKSIVKKLPQYNYIYLGDNARSPYGDHDFDTIYKYTLECVQWLFDKGCSIVILACNTASAKALRNIQQIDLPKIAPNNSVLGVIRPTAEIIGQYTRNNKVGVFGTRGTVNSDSYVIEINKFFPDIQVFQKACPMWVPLIENNEHNFPGSDYFVEKYCAELLKQDENIDCVLLACTHYPILQAKIQACLPDHIKVLSQGEIVANSLQDYLLRHKELESSLKKSGEKAFFTSGNINDFNRQASLFFGEALEAKGMF